MGRAAIRRTAWVVFALTVIIHLTALLQSHAALAALTQPLAMASLLTVLITSVSAWRPITVLTAVGLGLSLAGDILPALLPGHARMAAALFFLMALLAYCAALLPSWLRARDSLRALLAVPYAGVVIGLFVACADGAGALLPPMAMYAVALALMAFLAAGVNGLTWIGGTLFLASSSVLAMTWFLPGAWVPHANFWVMLTYFAAQMFLLLGILRVPAPARARTVLPGAGPGAAGATLVIVK